MGSEESPSRTHICKAFSKAHASQALKICARAGHAGPGGAGRGAWRAALACPGPRPAGFRRGQGSQTRRLAPGARAKADAGRSIMWDVSARPPGPPKDTLEQRAGLPRPLPSGLQRVSRPSHRDLGT